MALLSPIILDGGGGGEVQYYVSPTPVPYLPPAPVSQPVNTGVNVPTGIAPVYNPTVIPFSPTETVTATGGGGGLQVPVPVVPITQPQQSQPPTTSCATCGPKTSQPPTSSAGGASSTQQQGGGPLLAGALQAGSENWGLLLLIAALGLALYEGIKERKKGRR